jgi:hypothetical protein
MDNKMRETLTQIAEGNLLADHRHTADNYVEFVRTYNVYNMVLGGDEYMLHVVVQYSPHQLNNLFIVIPNTAPIVLLDVFCVCPPTSMRRGVVINGPEGFHKFIPTGIESRGYVTEGDHNG